ncbi:MAG: adenylyl-sulfate kinase [Planctomycetes bacterium]|nr:adenylyl-sulfate kinase [Planctomycetota bacterium]
MASARGFTLWFTGLSGAGKSTLAEEISRRLHDGGVGHEILDGDVVRTNLSKGLGFSREDRDTNILRIGFVAELLTRHEIPVITAAISPFRTTREEVRRNIGKDRFIEVYVEASLDELVRRDVKGLYAKALHGEIKNFTGVSDPYEAPTDPQISVNSETQSVEESADVIWNYLLANEFITVEQAVLQG